MRSRSPDILRTEIPGTNINATTFLATDYLNHFNEIVMLLDIIQEMPECIDDARNWQPKSYEEHFRDSHFNDRDLAIEAYHAALPEYREPLDEIVGRLNEDILKTLDQVKDCLPDQGNRGCAHLLADKMPQLKSMIKLASAVINGTSDATNRADIEAILNGEPAPDSLAQDEIDKLF